MATLIEGFKNKTFGNFVVLLGEEVSKNLRIVKVIYTVSVCVLLDWKWLQISNSEHKLRWCSWTWAMSIFPSNFSVSQLVPKILETSVCFTVDKAEMSWQVPKKITKCREKNRLKGHTDYEVSLCFANLERTGFLY